MLRSLELNPRNEERAETDSTGFLTVESDPDLAVRKQWGLYPASFGANYNRRAERERDGAPWLAASADVCSGLLTQLCNGSVQILLGAISRGKTRTFLQLVISSSQPPYLLEK